MEALQNDRDRLQYELTALAETHKHCLTNSSYALRLEIQRLTEELKIC